MLKKMTGRQLRQLEERTNQQLLKPRQSLHHDGRALRISKSVEVDGVFEGVKGMSDMLNSGAIQSPRGMTYLGSIDGITAANWAKECGAAIGTKEFQAYAKKKLMGSDYAHFRADRKKRVF